jgi:hypothetical protein
MERPCGPRAEQHPREKSWLTSRVLHKRSGIPGEEKETTAQKKGASFPSIRADGDAAAGRRVSPPRDVGSRGALTTAAFALRRTTAHQADDYPNDDGALAHPSLDVPASDID